MAWQPCSGPVGSWLTENRSDHSSRGECDQPRREGTHQHIFRRQPAVGASDLGKSKQALRRGYETCRGRFAQQHKHIDEHAFHGSDPPTRPRLLRQADPSRTAKYPADQVV